MATKGIKCKSQDNANQMEKESKTAQQVCNGLIIFGEFLIMWFKVMFEVCKALVQKFLPVQKKSVKGEIVLITGTGHGIGRELALQYAALGATVVGWDMNAETNEQTMKEINEMGGTKAYSYQCDVSSRQAILDLAKKVQEDVGNVTIVINNAGIMPCHPLAEHSEPEIRKIFDINVFAHFWMLEAFLPNMLENNYGHIVALSSMAGLCGLKNLVPYCSSKYAVRGLMEALSEELRETRPNCQVKFTTVCPYMVDTGLCKNPRIKFPSIMSPLPQTEVARIIVSSQRKNKQDFSIPGYMMPMNYLTRLFPDKCAMILKDFMDSSLESDQ